ncbi:hypothetical protein PLICRDRAFT_176843 [Plicaturopsis crispa FD-325 SS-3]|nr:hypothetical protein PLICRDRAFT_176843 [Plicaturopsis crispa FD-325 SS-3]
MHHTPWTKKASSLPSDRIQPRMSRPPTTPSSSKGKGKPKEPPKSKEVRRLEALLDGLRGSTGKDKDPSGGCFCQARGHDLSTFNPICRDCGLILCALNLPQYACPHCRAALLTPAARDSLIVRVEEQIADTLSREEDARERAAEEARRAVGAFPTLAGGAPTPAGAPAPNQTHKVLSLNSKTKKVTVSSFTKPPPRPVSRAEEEIEDEPDRLPPPPSEVLYATRKPDPARPWLRLRDENVRYVPPPVVAAQEQKGTNKRRRQTRGGDKSAGVEGGSRGPDASTSSHIS